MVKGKSYDILFWADAPVAEGETNPYTFDPATQTISVNTTVSCNDESRDAFFASVAGLEIKGASQKSVELKRPFAQLNLGATDTEAAADVDFVATKTQVKVKCYSTLNLFSGDVVDEATERTFALADIPSGETFPATGVTAQYLAMNYLLVNAKELVDVEFTVSNGSHDFTNTYSNVPVQRNHRTNIYGSLLTNATDFTITVNPIYGEDYPYNTELVFVGNNTYEVSTPTAMMQIAALIEKVNPSEANIITIKLTKDIDMSGLVWAPLAAHWVNIDGQGHTISNLNCGMDATAKSGFCGYLGASTIKDLTLHNVTAAGEQVGIIAGLAEAGTLENVTITGSNSVTYKNTEYDESWGGVGAIFGVNTAGERAVDITIQEGATIYIYNKSELVTEAPAGNKYAMINGVTVTDNGNVTNFVKTVTWSTAPAGATPENPAGTATTHEEAIANAPEGYRLPTAAEARLMLANSKQTQTNEGWIIEFNGQTINLPYNFNDGYADHVCYWVSDKTSIGGGEEFGLHITDINSSGLEVGCYPYFGDEFPAIYVKE